jgi:hypothetical protein
MSRLARYPAHETGPNYQSNRERYRGFERQPAQSLWLQKVRKRSRLWVNYFLFWFSGVWFLPALFSYLTAGIDHRMTLTILPAVILPLLLIRRISAS